MKTVRQPRNVRSLQKELLRSGEVWNEFHKRLQADRDTKANEDSNKRVKINQIMLEFWSPESMLGKNTYIFPPEIWSNIYGLLCRLLRFEYFNSPATIKLYCHDDYAYSCSKDHKCVNVSDFIHTRIARFDADNDERVRTDAYKHDPKDHCIFCSKTYRLSSYSSSGPYNKPMYRNVKRHLDHGRKIYLLKHVLVDEALHYTSK